MRRLQCLPIAVLMLILGASAGVHAAKPEDNPATRAQGQVIFERTCVWCHGVTGMGDGPDGWFLGRYAAPRPRNYTSGSFKFRSTPSGDLPTDQDLFRTVTKGIPGYMPSFASLPRGGTLAGNCQREKLIPGVFGGNARLSPTHGHGHTAGIREP